MPNSKNMDPLQELDMINKEATEEAAQDYIRIKMNYNEQLGEAIE